MSLPTGTPNPSNPARNPEPAAAPSHPSRVPSVLCQQGRSCRQRQGWGGAGRGEGTAGHSESSCRDWSSAGTGKGHSCSRMHTQQQQHSYFTAWGPKEFLCWGLMETQREWGDFQLVFELPSHTEQTSQHSGSAVAPHVRGVCSWFLSQKVPIQAFCGA